MSGQKEGLEHGTVRKHQDLYFHRVIEVLICCLGIYVTYLGYGLLHERLYTRLYRTQNKLAAHRFQYPLFLVFWQCFWNVTVAFFTRKAVSDGRLVAKPVEEGKRRLRGLRKTDARVPTRLYALLALCHLVAMCCAFGALLYVPYPLQVLAKSSKMIPIMLTGTVLRRRRYSRAEIGRVLLITFGVLQFSRAQHRGPVVSASAQGAGFWSIIGHHRFMGWILLLVSLMMDGVVGPLQEQVRAQYGVGAIQFMFAQNAWATLWLLPVLLVTGQGMGAWRFIQQHPDIWGDLLGFGLLSAAGQHFVFHVVCHFSALTLAMITTTRKFFTVLLSILFFAHRISRSQIIGVGCTFTGLLWEAVAGWVASRSHAWSESPAKDACALTPVRAKEMR
jgi:drug/metabolite transporter (DMT)-like permease